MSAKIIDGKAIAAEIQEELKERISMLINEGRRPGLASLAITICMLYKEIDMKKELIIAVILGGGGVIFLGFVLSNASMVKKTLNQKQPQTPAPTTSQNQNQTFTTSEVATHNSTNDCYMIVENNVYNLTDYLPEHPTDIAMYCGKDGTVAFNTRGGKGPHSDKAKERLNTMLVGTLIQ